jgi:hypothetical protein
METLMTSYEPDPRVESINTSAVTAMLKQIIANNRAGGWRKLKAGRGGCI